MTDRTGYRYDHITPETQQRWPDMSVSFLQLADAATEAAGFYPDAWLINRYEAGAASGPERARLQLAYCLRLVRITRHVPIRMPEWADKTQHIRIVHGDVLVWGGSDRRTLSFPASCRFIPAHCIGDFASTENTDRVIDKKSV